MTILLADDDPVTLDSLQTCVEREGYRALTAANGQEAWALWQRHRPDLLCLDIMMPQVDGYEVCRRVRAEDRQVPILFLSAKSEEIDVVVGLELGADDFIRKPFGKSEFIARLRTVVRRLVPPASAQAKSRFTMGPLTIFPRELRAERNGLSVDLSPREVAILELLHQHAGEAVFRDTILDSCWGLDYFPDSRTLDQHVSNLRKRIEPDARNPTIIRTVRGVGYRFVP